MKKMIVLMTEGETKNVLIARIKDCLANDVEEGTRYYVRMEIYSEVKTISEMIEEIRNSEKKSHENKE